MNRTLTKAALLLALAVGACGGAATNGYENGIPIRTLRIDADRMLADLRFLSSDELAGRMTGTPGNERAREHIRAAFLRHGLEPLGDSFTHDFSFTGRRDGAEYHGVNVVGRIRGTRFPDRHIVVTAHYDHVGIGQPDERGDSIYNGFSDNAAGVAMLLAIAEKMRDAPPARSVLFLFFTGEERGLLGSSYYVTAPAVPLERVAAVINLDAGAPAAPPRNWKIAGGKLSTLGDMASAVAQRNGWIADHTDPSPNSDHWPFLRQGVPAIFIIPGQDWEGVTRLEKEALQHRWENYHQPADEWHPDFPLQGLKRYAELALQIGFEAGDAKERPRIR